MGVTLLILLVLRGLGWAEGYIRARLAPMRATGTYRLSVGD